MLDFDDTDPIESLAALLTIVLARRHPEVEQAVQISQEMIDEAKGWALDLFAAMLALNYRVVRIPQDLSTLPVEEGI